MWRMRVERRRWFGGGGGAVTGTEGARGDHLSRGVNFNGALPGSESDTVMCVLGNH